MNKIMQNDATRLNEWLRLFLDTIRERGVARHVNEDEGYKFQAVNHFQTHFDINALDLAGNLDEAILNNNLIAGAMYFPKKMLLIYAETYPEDTRQILKNLFNKNSPVGERIDQTKTAFENLEKRRAKDTKNKTYHTYIGLRFISLLLGFYDPEQYNPLKPAEWKVFCRFIDPDFSIPHKTPPGEQYKIYSKYIESLRDSIMKRAEFKEIKDALTDGLEFNDKQYRWLVQDVIFVTARVYADKKAEESVAEETESKQTIYPDSVSTSSATLDSENTGFMPLEAHLEEYVIKNWESIDFGEELTMYVEDDGTTGQQYTTDVGIIDILAQDKNGDFVVLELKRADSNYKVVGQTLNYIGWVQDQLAGEGQKVRGLIIVGEADKTLKTALKPVSNLIQLKEYRVNMQLLDA